MSLKLLFALLAGSGALGIAVGYGFRWLWGLAQKSSLETEVKQLLLNAREEAQRITAGAEKKSKELLTSIETDQKEKEEKFSRQEERLFKREETLDKRSTELEAEVTALKTRIEDIKRLRERAEALISERTDALAKVAGKTKEEASAQLMNDLEREYAEDLSVRLQKLEREGAEKLDRRAKDILTTSIHRLGNAVNTDTLATAVTIPNDDIKGKIIGKEGRNIKAFERATGVEVIVDDTPGTIVLSSFDPIRRAVARVALENLIADGRIQPAKIEEITEKARAEIGKVVKEKGEQAAFDAGVHNLDPKLLQILGRMHFRTSYGQNVLQHSVEMAHIAGMLAQELGANVQVARTGALLHDIGKALDHEVQGTHVEIGRRILQKFNIDEAIIKAMQAHHGEYPFETAEAYIVQVADAISGGRPGARRDSVEQYIKRLADIEQIANSFEGVEKSFAISAGREVRVFVKPDVVNDLEAREIARNIAMRIESELKYPGEVKVIALRETRAVEFAR